MISTLVHKISTLVHKTQQSGCETQGTVVGCNHPSVRRQVMEKVQGTSARCPRLTPGPKPSSADPRSGIASSATPAQRSGSGMQREPQWVSSSEVPTPVRSGMQREPQRASSSEVPTPVMSGMQREPPWVSSSEVPTLLPRDGEDGQGMALCDSGEERRTYAKALAQTLGVIGAGLHWALNKVPYPRMEIGSQQAHQQKDSDLADILPPGRGPDGAGTNPLVHGPGSA